MAKFSPKLQIEDSHDKTLFIVTLLLVIFGTLMVFSSSVIMADIRFQSPYMFVSKHLIWVVIGTFALIFFSKFNYRSLQTMSKPLYIAVVVLLLLVLFIGTSKGGAKRWLRWGPISVQPSEIAKLVTVIVLADYLDRKKSKLKKIKGIIPPLLIAGFLCALVAVEPDLGTPIIIMATTLALLYVAGAKFKYILSVLLLAVPVVIAEILRKPYRLARVKAYLASWWDISSTSYQLDQSILALGSGGFIGKGLAQSQMKMLYLPKPHTDFIFPIVGEELGFIGAAVLIVLFGIFTWRGITISRHSTEFFGAILALGITFLIALQAFLNMGVASGLLPTKGLPLPFVSFGGTALLINMAEVGILLSISKNMAGREKK